MSSMISLPVQERFRIFIQPHINQFLKQLNSDIEFDINRVTVWADTDTFRYKDDEYVWKQKREKVDNVYAVYIDSIFICYLTEHLKPQELLKSFWEGFLKAYNLEDNDSRKLWLDKTTYEKKRQEQRAKELKRKKEIEKAIKDKPVKTEVQAQAKEIALDVVKKQ